MAWWNIICVYSLGFLHFNEESNSVFKLKPKVTSLILKFLSIDISEIVFIRCLVFVLRCSFNHTKSEIVLNDMIHGHSFLPRKILVDSYNTVILGKAEFSFVFEHTNFRSRDIIELFRVVIFIFGFSVLS